MDTCRTQISENHRSHCQADTEPQDVGKYLRRNRCPREYRLEKDSRNVDVNMDSESEPRSYPGRVISTEGNETKSISISLGTGSGRPIKRRGREITNKSLDETIQHGLHLTDRRHRDELDHLLTACYRKDNFSISRTGAAGSRVLVMVSFRQGLAA